MEKLSIALTLAVLLYMQLLCHLRQEFCWEGRGGGTSPWCRQMFLWFVSLSRVINSVVSKPPPHRQHLHTRTLSVFLLLENLKDAPLYLSPLAPLWVVYVVTLFSSARRHRLDAAWLQTDVASLLRLRLSFELDVSTTFVGAWEEGPDSVGKVDNDGQKEIE